MTPGARVAMAIELLDEVITAARDGGAAADTIATSFFKTRRFAGSKDRRAVRDLAWAAIRLCGDRPRDGRAAMLTLADRNAELAVLFDGAGHAPTPVRPGEPRATAAPVPAWLRGAFDPLIDADEQAALLERATLDLRVNAARANGVALPEGTALAAPLNGLRLPIDTTIDDQPAMLAGAAAVQDAGSQLIVAACGARPAHCIIDLCAGAGGKALALAAAMQGDSATVALGRIIACDIDRRRLGQLAPRAAIEGVDALIATRLLNPQAEAEALADLAGQADVVLVDAPCSGTGTWRRNPEARWRLTPARLERMVAEQARLLRIAAPLVRPGGALVYAVCSLLAADGAAQIDAFLAAYPDWQAQSPLPGGERWGRASGAGLLLSPLHDHSDGFFFARLQAPSPA